MDTKISWQRIAEGVAINVGTAIVITIFSGIFILASRVFPVEWGKTLLLIGSGMLVGVGLLVLLIYLFLRYIVGQISQSLYTFFSSLPGKTFSIKSNKEQS